MTWLKNKLEVAELSLNDPEVEAMIFTFEDEERYFDDIAKSAQVEH